MKNEGTVSSTVRKTTTASIRTVLAHYVKLLLDVKSTLLCSKVLLVSSEKLVYTASFVRYRTERNFWFSDVKTISYKVIMKKIEYCLFDVVVEFHREMITSQLQGKLRLYDEVRARTLFVLSSSNRGRLLGIIDLMRQKNKRMKQEGLNRQIGILQKMEFDYKLMIGKLQDSHGALDLGSTRVSMKNEGTVSSTVRKTTTASIRTVLAHYVKLLLDVKSTAVMFEDDIVQCIFLDGFELHMLVLREDK
ncbi:hypothetical protein Tco_0781964 [Tanacetum coccineum]